MNDPIDELQSEDPRRRFRALASLRHDYRPEAGNALVKALIDEKEAGVWWLACACVVPIWIPLLDRTLLDFQAWPLSSYQTLHILDRASGHVLHSAARFAADWAKHAHWEWKFAGFRWLIMGGSHHEACSTASDMLSTIRESFCVNVEGQFEASWISSFNDVSLRVKELASFHDENCAP